MTGTIKRVFLLSMMLALGGCLSIERDTTERRDYLIEPRRGPAPEREALASQLAVEAFEVSPAYASRSLVLRKSGNRIEADYYHRFFLAPGRMLAGAARDWLAESGLFGRVTQSLDADDALRLDATVEELYGDFRGDAEAVLTLHAFLSRGEELLWHRRYEMRRRLERKSPEGLVGALEATYSDLLSELEADLAEALGD